MGEVPPAQCCAHAGGFAAAAFGERDVAAPRVSPNATPLGFTMSDEHDLSGHLSTLGDDWTSVRVTASGDENIESGDDVGPSVD